MIFAIDLNPLDNVIDATGGLIGSATEAAGASVLNLVVEFVFGLIVDAVAAVTESLIAAMNATTGVDLEGGFFEALTPIRQIVLGMSMTLLLAFFFAAVIRALAAGEPGAIIRTALVDVPASVLLMMLSVSVAWVLIRIVDAASLGVTGDVGETVGELAALLKVADVLTGAGLLGIIFGVLFVVAALLVWLQLLVRAALIHILIVLAPLGFATRAHPSTRQIARRTIEMGVALILSKFGVAVAFGVGAAAIRTSDGVESGSDANLSGMMTGVAVMLMAAFMPWLVWKAFPLVEAATTAAGVERAPARAAVAGASMAVAATVGISKLAGSGTTGTVFGSAGGMSGAAPGGEAPGGGGGCPAPGSGPSSALGQGGRRPGAGGSGGGGSSAPTGAQPLPPAARTGSAGGSPIRPPGGDPLSGERRST